MSKTIRMKKTLRQRLTNDNDRNRLQFIFVYTVFAVVSLAMAIVNIATNQHSAAVAIGLYFVFNVTNLLLSISRKTEKIARVLFSLESINLFTYMIASGEPEGYSAIWVAIMPIGGMLLYRRRYGTILSAVMLLELIFFFYLPFGRELIVSKTYTESFMLRFPILYCVFFVVGYFFELIREYTQEELTRIGDKYRKQSLTDTLTGLGNETAYFSEVERIERQMADGSAKFGIALMDVNCVKVTNDSYGHRFGCHLIVTASHKLPEIFKTSKCFHVGGDEFVVILGGSDYNNADDIANDFEKELGYQHITFEGVDLVLSVAVGTAIYKKGEKYNDVLQRADDKMYQNKKILKEKHNITIR